MLSENTMKKEIEKESKIGFLACSKNKVSPVYNFFENVLFDRNLLPIIVEFCDSYFSS